MKRNIISLAIAGLLLPAVATAATVTAGPGGVDNGYATTITYEDDNTVARRGDNNGRDNALNALGAPDTAFFELGFGSTADFTFGALFDSSASVAEVTFGNSASNGSFPESVDIFVGVNGVFTFVQSLTNAAAQTMASVSLAGLGGPFDTLRLVDTSPFSSSIESDKLGALGGFDIESVRVAPVPLPASGLMLLGALGGAAALRRKKAK